MAWKGERVVLSKMQQPPDSMGADGGWVVVAHGFPSLPSYMGSPLSPLPWVPHLPSSMGSPLSPLPWVSLSPLFHRFPSLPSSISPRGALNKRAIWLRNISFYWAVNWLVRFCGRGKGSISGSSIPEGGLTTLLVVFYWLKSPLSPSPHIPEFGVAESERGFFLVFPGGVNDRKVFCGGHPTLGSLF